jgi:hypothetical protein
VARALTKPVKLRLFQLALALAAPLAVSATTLQYLSVDAMVAKSTQIVRATVAPASSFQRGAMIYTNYQLTVTSTLKGTPAASLQVAVPGGDYRGMHQSVSGAPVFTAGQEYVVFVWTGPSGTSYVIGLGQGVFQVQTNSSGVVVLTRGPVDAQVLDAAGTPTAVPGVTLLLSDLLAKIGN